MYLLNKWLAFAQIIYYSSTVMSSRRIYYCLITFFHHVQSIFAISYGAKQPCQQSFSLKSCQSILINDNFQAVFISAHAMEMIFMGKSHHSGKPLAMKCDNSKSRIVSILNQLLNHNKCFFMAYLCFMEVCQNQCNGTSII